MRKLLGILYHLLHSLLWITGSLLCLGLLLLCIAAYGIPGKWIMPYINAHLTDTSLKLQFDRISYFPIHGIRISDFQLGTAEKPRLVSFSTASVGFDIFTTGHWEKRLTKIELEDLFVAQIEYDESDRDTPDTLPPPEEQPPFPDFSDLQLPQLENVRLNLLRTDVLELTFAELTGTLSVKGGTLHFSDLKSKIDDNGQTAEADVDVNVHEAFVKAHIRGFIFQTHLNGIWHALDFPVIEHYSNNFSLKAPAWADCAFTVGFNKYRNLFHLTVDIVAKEGAYCGVPFDEANGTIVCHGIWDTVTTISPLVARRNGEMAAQGELIFDTVKDRFIFRAEGNKLQADEALRLIDMPFTEVIPEIVGNTPPHLTIQGNIPLLSEQTPDKVDLSATIRLPDGGTINDLPVASAQTDLLMKEGTLSLNNFTATLEQDGLIRGNAAFQIPNEAEYTDLSALIYLEQAPLSALLAPLHITTTPTDSTLTGFVDLTCRTDQTFATSLKSNYSLTLHGGIITRIPLFAGLTDLIADNIPGISSITDSSTAKLIGSADNGIFNIPEFTLTGDLLSIEGPIRYDLPNDYLLAQIMAGNFKRDSVLGYLTRWVTVPLNKLMWQIKVTGPIADPDWQIVTIIEGIWNKVRGEEDSDHPEQSESES